MKDTDMDAWRDQCADAAVLSGRRYSRGDFLDDPGAFRVGDLVQDLDGERGVVLAADPDAVTWGSGRFVYSTRPRDLLLLAPAGSDAEDAAAGAEEQAAAPLPWADCAATSARPTAAAEPDAPRPWADCAATSAKLTAASFALAVLAAALVLALDWAVDRLADVLGVAGTLAAALAALAAAGCAVLRATARGPRP